MELAKYKACICEGSAEEAIIDCEATLCHPHRRRFEISRNSDGGDALAAMRRSNARRDDALSLPCLMPGNSSRHETRP